MLHLFVSTLVLAQVPGQADKIESETKAFMRTHLLSNLRNGQLCYPVAQTERTLFVVHQDSIIYQTLRTLVLQIELQQTPDTCTATAHCPFLIRTAAAVNLSPMKPILQVRDGKNLLCSSVY